MHFLDQSVLDGLWYWDLQAPTKEWMSPKFWQVLGYDPQTKQHNPSEWQDIIHPEDLKLATENLNKHLDDPTHPYDQIVRYKHAQGHWVWIRCRGQAMFDEAGNPKRLMGYTDLVLMSSKDPYCVERLERVKEQTQNLTHLINDILLFSRLEAGQETFHEIEFTIGDLVRKVVGLKVLSVLPKGIEFLPRIGISPQARVKADLYRIVTVIDHLLDNAIKFSHQGDVEFKLELSPTQPWPMQPRNEKVWLRFSVIDHGIGIANDNLTLIFNPYNQVDNSDTREYGGAGLGLTICRALVRIMQGEMAVESELAQGSTFYFDVPVEWLDDEI